MAVEILLACAVLRIGKRLLKRKGKDPNERRKQKMKSFKVWARQNGLKADEQKSICAVKFTNTKNGKSAYYDMFAVVNCFTKKSIEEIAKTLA